MDRERYPIPVGLNLLIATAQVGILVGLFWLAGRVESPWAFVVVALCYGITMNSGYATLHEAEHNLFHPNPRINTLAGVILGLFFPAPYHLLRQGHLGHHMRNRSDDEAFDLYFDGENPVWKHLQLYGVLTGCFWLLIYLSNVVALINPALLSPKYAGFDRPTQALLESLNPTYRRLIRFEAAVIILLHSVLLYGFAIPWWRYFALVFAFGFMWSALQYAHHYGTARDVLKGARNLKTLVPLDRILLNHNWHLIHHMHPTVPWLYLPQLGDGKDEKRESMVRAYLTMWRGPRFSHERVQSRYAGVIIR